MAQTVDGIDLVCHSGPEMFQDKLPPDAFTMAAMKAAAKRRDSQVAVFLCVEFYSGGM